MSDAELGESAKPLIGDRARDASATIGGFVYQIWQSLEAWLELDGSDVLWLEGAEDFDVTSVDSGTATQVKHTRRPISLGSKAAIDALNAFWLLRRDNPTRKVKYRFLTSAPRGIERNRPFGSQRGLDYWDACRLGKADPLPLATYIRKRKGISADLQIFLDQTSAEIFRREVLQNFWWNTHAPDSAALVDLVTRKVVSLADDKFGTPSIMSRPIASILYERLCRHVLSRSSHPLDRQDLLGEIEKHCIVPIPVRMLYELQRPMPGPESSSLAVQGGNSTLLRSRPRQTPTRGCSRSELCQSVTQALNVGGRALLMGVSGAGKSTVAALAGAMDQRTWQWVRFGGRRGRKVVEPLMSVAATLVPSVAPAVLVLDDLGVGVWRSEIALALETLAVAADRCGTALLVTCHGPVGDWVLNALGATLAARIRVPSLTAAEIEEILIGHGCPANRVEEQVRELKISTGGLASLVDACVKRSVFAQWKRVARNEVGNDGIEQVRFDARRRLASELPDAASQTMAAKLSIFFSEFSREHAMHLCSAAPEVQDPGAVLDRLIGPWIEERPNGRFAVSPLLSRSASSRWDAQTVQGLHRHAGAAYLRTGTLTGNDCGVALLHSAFGGDLLNVAKIAVAALPAVWKSREFAVFLSVPVRAVSRLLRQAGANAETRALLETLRFQCAYCSGDAREAHRALRSAQSIIDQLPAQFKDPLSFQLYSLRAQATEVDVEPEEFVDIAVGLRRLGEQLAGRGPGSPWNAATIRTMRRSVISAMGAIRYARDGARIERMLRALDGLDEDVRADLVADLGKPEFAEHLVSASWLAESEGTRDWAEQIRRMRLFQELGWRWQKIGLWEAAVRVESIVLDENLNRPDEALGAIDRARARLGGTSALLDLAEFVVLYRKTDSGRAREVGYPLLKQGKLNRVEQAFLAQRLLVCSRDALGPVELIEICGIGRANASRAGDALSAMSVGFVAEQALVKWKNGEFAQGAREMIKAGEEIFRLNLSESRPLTVMRLIANAMAWMCRPSGEDSWPSLEPLSGQFTDLESINEGALRALPKNPESYFWTMAAFLEDEWECGDLGYQRLQAAALRDGTTTPTAVAALSRHRRRLSEGNLENLMADIGAITAWASRAGEVVEDGPLDDAAGRERRARRTRDGEHAIMAGTVVLMAQGGDVDQAIEGWSGEGIRLGFSREVLEDYAGVAIASSKTYGELRREMMNSHARSERRAAACLAVLRLTPDLRDMFYSHVMVTQIIVASISGRAINRWWGDLVAKMWERALRDQRFAFRRPNLAESVILAACRADKLGFARAAHVLLAVDEDLQLGSEVREGLMSMSEGRL